MCRFQTFLLGIGLVTVYTAKNQNAFSNTYLLDMWSLSSIEVLLQGFPLKLHVVTVHTI